MIPPQLLERKALCIFLREAARFFEKRPTHGEDSAYWANVFNAEKCRAAADMLEADVLL